MHPHTHRHTGTQAQECTLNMHIDCHYKTLNIPDTCNFQMFHINTERTSSTQEDLSQPSMESNSSWCISRVLVLHRRARRFLCKGQVSTHFRLGWLCVSVETTQPVVMWKQSLIMQEWVSQLEDNNFVLISWTLKSKFHIINTNCKICCSSVTLWKYKNDFNLKTIQKHTVEF